ncbi:MAG: DUF1016 family protein [Desulfamplus sp.]|nr:DUF1016 family protein [Desulfamplus sp.]
MNTNKHELVNFNLLVQQIIDADKQLAENAVRAVNINLTLRNWCIGAYIHGYELHGNDRANYGDRLFEVLAGELKQLSNCNKRQLYRYLKFFQFYPQIVGTVSPQLHPEPQALLNRLSYSQFDFLVDIDDDNPPIGILLCTDKEHALIEYALADLDKNLFVSKYQLELPDKKAMQRFIEDKLSETMQGDDRDA